VDHAAPPWQHAGSRHASFQAVPRKRLVPSRAARPRIPKGR
jgi:hypothetical protein